MSSDLTGLLQNLDKGLQDSSNTNDLLVLGFDADVSAEMTKINSHNLNLLLQASQNPPGAGRSFCSSLKQQCVTLPPYSHTRHRLQSLKSYLTQKSDSTDKNAGAVCHNPLLDFFQTEQDALIDSVSLLLSQLQQPIEYGSVTFSSLLGLTELSHLERRAELLSSYLCGCSTSDPAGAYRLAAFKNARGLLVAVMRQAAHFHRKHISDLTLHLQVRFKHWNHSKTQFLIYFLISVIECM